MDNTYIKRTHDKEIYLNENRLTDTKEYFKLLVNRSIDSGVLRPQSHVADIGCATGEFLYYLSQRSPQTKIYGADIISEFIDRAKESIPSGHFIEGSVTQSDLYPTNSFDITYLLGVAQIFDQWEDIYENIVNWTKPGGRAYVFGPFNQYEVDVWVKYKLCSDPELEHREPGWNIISQKSIGTFLDKNPKVKNYQFTSFEMPFDIKAKKNDPIRTWTFKQEDGQRMLTNGLSIIPQYAILEIEL